MKYRLFLFFVLALLLVPGQVTLAAGGYHVEALLFSQPLNAEENGNEAWPPVQPNFWQPESGLVQSELTPAQQPVKNPADLPYARVHAKTLLATSARLKNDSRYRVLQLAAWELPHLKKAQSPEVSLAATEASLPASISAPDGGIKTYILGNFLYLKVAICRSVPMPLTPSQDSTTMESTLPTTPRQVRFCIREQRRIKLGDVNYFDHPGMGLLVRVDRAVDFELPVTRHTNNTSESIGK